MLAVAASISMLLAIVPGCGDDRGNPGGSAAQKILVLGCDGMDYRLVSRMLDEGRLPNMAKLREQGGFRPLTTSIPPQSPVAWSNFITGAGPGVHGIFDFIHRDPAHQAAPYFSTNRIVTTQEKDPWKLGQYQIPRSESKNELLRRGIPFWDYLDEAGIPVQMYRLPANYPPSASTHGHMCCLAGMGVPDALGSQGTYQHYTTKPRRESKGLEGYKLRIRKDFKSGAYVGKLNGPPNEYRDKNPEMQIPLYLYADPENDVAKLVYVNEGVLGDETVELILNVGQWSPWQEVHFLKTPVGPTFSTMVRFLLQSLRPQIELYVTPLNFIPTNPIAQISEPPQFVEEIGKAIGPFYTQGFAEEFNARKHNLFTDEEYRIQSWYVLEERLKMLEYALDHFEEGLLFFYFSSSDLQAHIFWWDSDEKHPIRDAETARKYHAVVEDVYVKIDEALGRCMERLGKDATIIVMSDHGFCNFRRGVSVNTWLRNEGYLVADKSVTVDADWSKTRAYGLGVSCSIYLNLKGREKFGIVEPSEREALLEEISAKLLALKDPETGRRVIHRVYRSDQCYSGPEVVHAPDLILGYERGYRASWNSCLGGFDKEVVVDNTKAWCADHCTAHDLVPGILLSNKKIRVDAPALIDVAPTILAEFGVPKPDQMTGRSFFGETRTMDD